MCIRDRTVDSVEEDAVLLFSLWDDVEPTADSVEEGEVLLFSLWNDVELTADSVDEIKDEVTTVGVWISKIVSSVVKPFKPV